MLEIAKDDVVNIRDFYLYTLECMGIATPERLAILAGIKDGDKVLKCGKTFDGWIAFFKNQLQSGRYHANDLIQTMVMKFGEDESAKVN